MRPSSPIAYVLLYVALYGAFGVASPFWPKLFESKGLVPQQIGLILGAALFVRLAAGPLVLRLPRFFRYGRFLPGQSPAIARGRTARGQLTQACTCTQSRFRPRFECQMQRSPFRHSDFRAVVITSGRTYPKKRRPLLRTHHNRTPFPLPLPYKNTQRSECLLKKSETPVGIRYENTNMIKHRRL